MCQVVIARFYSRGRAQIWCRDSLMLEMQAVPLMQSVVGNGVSVSFPSRPVHLEGVCEPNASTGSAGGAVAGEPGEAEHRAVGLQHCLKTEWEFL